MRCIRPSEAYPGLIERDLRDTASCVCGVYEMKEREEKKEEEVRKKQILSCQPCAAYLFFATKSAIKVSRMYSSDIFSSLGRL